MSVSGLTGHIEGSACGLSGLGTDRFAIFCNTLRLLLFRSCHFFRFSFGVEVDCLTGLLVAEELYPEQNRFDWLRLPSLQTKRPSDVQCAIPPFEPEQGCLPRAASACAVNSIPETRIKINFLISISVIYFVTLWLSNPKAINRFVRKTSNDLKH